MGSSRPGGRRAGRVEGTIMIRAMLRVAVPFVVTSALWWLTPGIAAAHIEAGANVRHVIAEVAYWGLGVAITLGIIVAIFWVRAALLRRFRS